MAGEPGGVPLLDQQPAMDGGLNNVSDDILVQPNQLRKAINCRLTDYGAITKRGGTQRVSDVVASASILNGYTWRRDGGTQQLLVVTNERLYTATYGAFPITWTQRTGAVSATVSPTFAQFRDGTNDVVYITDGGLLNKWDGTTFSVNLANTSAVESITVHNQRLWGCGNSSFPDSIFYSALNGPKLYISDRCQNLVYSMQEYTARGGKDEATKDPIDCLRYLLVSNCEFVDPQAAKSVDDRTWSY